MMPNELAKTTTLILGPLLSKKDQHKVELLDLSLFQKIILLDGAADKFPPPWPKSWTLIGDADSCSPEHRPYFDQLLAQDKDQSDLSFALEHLIPKRCQHLLCEGVTGGRLDHEVINLGEVNAFLQQRPDTLVSWGPQLMAYPKGQHRIEHTGSFSLFSLQEQNLSLSGDAQWPLQDQHIFPCSSRTLSNWAQGVLELTCEAPVFFYKPQDQAST